MTAFSTLATRLARFAGFAAAGIAILAVVLLLIAGFSSFGARLLADTVSALASNQDRTVSISAPEGLLSGHLRVESITVGDREGPYAAIDHLVVDWSPLSLLRGTFHAEHIAAEKITVARKPILPDEKDDKPFSLPLALEIEKIDAPLIELGEALLGERFALSANGALEAHSDAINLTLDASNRDQTDARASAALVYAPTENRLQVEASLSEPKGGLLTRLAKLPENPSVELALNGSGPLSDWKGRLSGTVDGKPVLALDAAHRLSGENHAVTVQGGGQLAELLPPALRPLFAGSTWIAAAATFSDAGRIDIQTGRITNAALDLDSHGAFDPAGGTNDLVVNLKGTNGPVDLRAALEDGEARLLVDQARLSLTGPTTAAHLELTASIVSAALPQGGLSGIDVNAKSDALDLAAAKGRIDAILTASAASFTDENLARLIRAPIKITLPLTLNGDSVTVTAAGLESASVGATLNATLGLADQSMDGDIKLFALPSVLPPGLAEKLNQTIAVEAKIATQKGDIRIDNLKLRSELLEADGSLSLVNDELQTALTGRLPDLGLVAQEASGTSTFTLSAKGPLQALAFKANVLTDEAVLAGKPVRNLMLNAEGSTDKAAPSANVTLEGFVDGQPVKGSALLAATAQGSQIPKLVLDAGPNRLTGNLRLTRDFLPAEGTVSFDFPDVSLLAALAGQKAEGSINGDMALATRNGTTSLEAKASGSIESAGAALQKLSLALSMPDIKAIAVDGKLTAARAGTASAAVENLSLDIAHGGDTTQVNLNGRYDNAPLALKGSIQQVENAISLRLDALNAAPKGIAVRLAQPATIAVEDGTARFNGIRIITGNGSVTVSGSAGKTLDVKAAIAALPANLANAFAPDLAAEGTINGTVSVTGTPSSPAVDYRLDWANAATSQTRGAGLSALAIKANGLFADNRVKLDTTVNGAGGIAIAGGGTVDLAGAKALQLAFKGRVPLAALQAKLSEQGMTAEGAADLDLVIAGTAAQPAITGTVNLAGARVIDVRRNLTLNNLTGAIRFDGKQATITALTGKLGGGGTVSVSGTVGIDPAAGLPADIAVKLDRATYADGTLFTSSATGDMALKGPLLSAPVLSGRLSLANTAITIPEKLPATLSEIDIRHRNAPGDVKAQAGKIAQKETNGSSSTIGLDLVVSAPSGIFVRGRGIDAELGGDLTVRGTATDPVVSGGYQMRRGRMTVLSRRLDFSSGTISFGGALIPTLNLEATTASDATTITVSVTGLANDPTIAFSSSPALPQDEVMAQLIFRQSMAKLSPLQIAQLADAVRQLAGGRSTSLFDKLRSNLGVDDLDLTTDAKGQTKVSAGKYLNDRTYLQLEQGGSGGGKAIINLDVGKGVKLRGEAGADGSGAGGIFYEKEY